MYPRTLMEFDRQFGSEEACRTYLIRMRWPNGIPCPRCGHSKCWHASRGRLVCRQCQHQLSATSGTIFHRSHQPLQVWFKAIWWVTSQKTGESALGLQRVLGLGSYETAWLLLHKLRRAMLRPGRERLRGVVEVDDTYVGGRATGPRGRGAFSKAIVVIAAEVRGRGMGRIRLQHVPDVSATCLVGFVKAAVESGAVVQTDGWRSYLPLARQGYRHKRRSLVGEGASSRLLPHVHRVASLLKRWLLGTHQGRLDGKHVQAYLDEFVFRFNRRTSRHRGKLFYRVLQHAIDMPPSPYRRVIRGRTVDPHNI